MLLSAQVLFSDMEITVSSELCVKVLKGVGLPVLGYHLSISLRE